MVVASWWAVRDVRFEVMKRQADLLQVIGALHASSSFAGRLHGRQQQPDQDADDGDDHQEFNESKT